MGTDAARKWLHDIAPPLTSEESRQWLESKNYSAEAFLAILATQSLPPAGTSPDDFLLEMLTKHRDDPAVVLYGSLMFPSVAGKSFPPKHLIDLDPENPLGYFLAAASAVKSGDEEESFRLIKKASALTGGTTSYLDRVRPLIREMILFSGRSPEGAAAWANFSINEIQVASIYTDLNDHFNRNPPETPRHAVQRAAVALDIAFGMQEVPLAGPDLLTWANLNVIPAALRYLDGAEQYIPEVFGDSAQNVTDKIKSFSDEGALLNNFFGGQHCNFLDGLPEPERNKFYEDSLAHGTARTYLNYLSEHPR
jgi:hypothetical protein